MVERHHLIEEHQVSIRYPQFIGGQLRQTLDLSHHVVAEEANCSRGKRRQPRQRRRPMPTQGRLELLKDISFKAPRLCSLSYTSIADGLPFRDNDPPTSRHHTPVRFDPDKSIPPYPLAAFD